MAREMKDSGIEWIGRIPSDWDVTKVLNGLIMPITDGPHTTPELYDDGVAFVSAEAVSCGNGRIDFSHVRGYISKDFYQECCKKYIPAINDIYMIKSGATTGKVAIVDTLEQLFTIWSPLAVFRCNEDILLPKYLYYQLQSDSFQKQVEQGWTYGTQQNIGMRSIEKLLITLPSVREQTRIASFLDAECARIDSVIEQTRASIEEYKKLKQAVITRAVTKGIRPDRAMKDSGIPVIGDIPVDWSVQRIKNVAQINGRIGFRGYTTDDLVEEGEGAITLSPSNLCELKMSYAKCSYISWEKYDESPEIQIENGDVLFVKTGSSYGKSSLVSDLPLQATINPQLVVFKNITIDNRFFLYSLQTPSLRNEIEGIVSGGTIPTMGQEKMKNFHLCVPVRGEQIEIADYLDSLCSELDMIISLKGRLIRELEEMKKSLIFEYVTGKKEAPL